MHPRSSLKSVRNVRLPIIHNLPWGLQTAQHRLDRLLVRTLVTNLSRNNKQYLLLLRRLILLAYILTDLRLFHRRPKVLRSECHRIHLSQRSHRHCHLQLRQVLGVAPRLVLLPVQLPALVALRLVRRGTAETTDTLLRPSTVHYNKQVKGKASEVAGEIACLMVHRPRFPGQAKALDLKPRSLRRKIKVDRICLPAVGMRRRMPDGLLLNAMRTYHKIDPHQPDEEVI